MKKRIVSLLIAMVMLFAVSPCIFANPVESIGSCGENVSWAFDEQSKTLTISGTGAMFDYDVYEENAPAWHYELCENINYVVISDGVTHIGNDAFNSLYKVTEFSIADSVVSIGYRAFANCYDLTSIIVPDSVETIGSAAFAMCDYLREVKLSEQITEIPNQLFTNCNRLETVDLSDNVTLIGKEAFDGCWALRDFSIPSKVTSIGEEAFFYCESLTEISIPVGVTSIPRSAFAVCEGVTKVFIPESVTHIESAAFSCENLIDVYYGGTEEAWERISIGTDNDYLINARIHYESTGFDDEGVPPATEPDNEEEPDEGPIFVESITLDKGELLLFEGEQERLNVTLFPGDATEDIFWSSSDESVAVCENGRVYAISEGSTTITVSAESGMAFAGCEVTVRARGNSSGPVGEDDEENEDNPDDPSLPGDDVELTIEARALVAYIEEIQPNSCYGEENVVTLTDDLMLSETIIIPTGENVILDIGRYDIIVAGDFEAISVPANASLTLEGRGMVIGGTDEEQGKPAIHNKGVLTIDDSRLEIIGGGTVMEDEPNGSGGSSGGASSGSGGGSSSRPRSSAAGAFSDDDGGGVDPIDRATPGEYVTEATEIPGTTYAQIGGFGVQNEGTLVLCQGKIIGGKGIESSASAISGNITGGACIVHSDDDRNYQLITSSETDKRYVFFREGTSAEGLYTTWILANRECCEYTYIYNEENESYKEKVTMLKNATLPSYGGDEMSRGFVLDTNGYTIHILPNDDEENRGSIGGYYIQIMGDGTINGNIVFGYAIVEEGTINGNLVADSVGMYKLEINGGTINGSIHTLGGTLEINGGVINGLIETYSTDIVVNGGIISGGTNAWPFEIGDRLSSVTQGGEIVWQHLYDGNLGTIWIRRGDITVNAGTITGWVDHDGTTGHPAISYTETYREQTEVHLIFDGGEITGGVGTQTSGKAVVGLLSKNEGSIIKQSDDGQYWTVLEENTTEKTYLKSGTGYCISVKNGTAYKSNDLATPIMEANAGELVILVADVTPAETMFKKWNISGVEIGNITGKTVSFVMPASNVVCEAVYVSEDWYEITAGEASAIMNGQDYVMSIVPVSRNQKVFALPRDLADGMEIECAWNHETKEITFSTENKQLSYILGSEYCISVDEQVLVDVKAVMNIFLAEDFWVLGDENKVVAKKKTDENTATITLSAQHGSTTGAGDYYMGSSVTISTTTNSGYSFSGWYDGETKASSTTTYTFVADADRSFVAKSIRSGGGGSDYAYATTISQRVENADGTVTYIKTVAGKTVKETTLLDGSKKVEEISKDGTEKVTVTDKNGDTDTTIKYPDGTKIREKKIKNGVSVKTVTSANNETSAVVTGTGDKKTDVTVPVEDVSGGVVAVVIDDDGTEKVIKNCLPSEEGLNFSVSEDTEVKIVDRSKPFSDTEKHWANDSIDFVVARDLFKGTSEKEFSPDGYMTRGMFAVVLHNYENNPELKTEGQFLDVDSDSWYHEAICWLHDKGVVSGYIDGKFGAEDHITREQLVTLFYRYAGSPQMSDTAILFDDSESISEYAKNAMSWALENGIINGKGENKLDPKGLATRAECSVMIQRFIKSIH